MSGDGSGASRGGTTGRRAAGAPPGDDGGLSIQERYDILSNRRRRLALFYLAREADGPVDADDLARQVAAWEDGVPVEALSYDDRRSVYTSLRQHHLPKLADAGAVDYDREAGTTSLTDRGRALEVYPSAGAGDDLQSVGPTTAGLTVFSALLAAGAVADAPVLTAVPDVAALAFLLGVALAGVAAVAAVRGAPGAGTARPPEVEATDPSTTGSEGDS